MTRLFVLLPFIVRVLASMGSGSSGSDMGSSPGEVGATSSTNSNGDQEISIDIGPIQIKIVGSFSGLGQWQWQGAKPGENSTIHQVTVGDVKDGAPVLAYDPPSIEALPGEYVQFNFKAQNHTVTQSTLEKPCVKMAGGMDSGFMPNPNNTMPIPPSMMVAINDTKPLWFYCRQATHCGKGMAFGINPGGADKMTEFLNNAKSQNGTAANGTGAPNALAANGTSSGNGTAGSQNGLPASSAVPSPTSSPLSDLVPGPDDSTGGDSDGAGSGAQEDCTCNCLCDLGSPGMGGLIGAIPLPSTGALGKRGVRF